MVRLVSGTRQYLFPAYYMRNLKEILKKFLSSSFKLLKYQEGNGGVKFVREQLCPAVKWSALC